MRFLKRNKVFFNAAFKVLKTTGVKTRRQILKITGAEFLKVT